MNADGTEAENCHKTGSTTTTDYCGNMVYENGVPKLLLTDEVAPLVTASITIT